MADQPRDWDKELAEIDRLLAKAPTPAPRSDPPAVESRPSVPGAPPPVSRRSVVGTWARVAAGVVLAAAMTQWPYTHACGVPLFLYTLAVGAVVVTGGWAAAASWRSRLAAAHVSALLVMAWGVGLLAAIVLPRIGYAAASLGWLCP